ncbi:MAG: NUDIX hydrolase [Anaerolineae bacterium]
MTDRGNVDHHTHFEPPGPALNYCPECGTPLQDRQAFGRLRRYCPRCRRIVFREHKVAAAMLVTDHRDRVLLVRRAWKPQQGYWSLPAGFVDYGETPAEAAVRECLEETGLEIEIEGLRGIVAGREHERGADIVIIYRGRIVGGEMQADDDASDLDFFAPDQLPPLAFAATRKVIACWRSPDRVNAEVGELC